MLRLPLTLEKVLVDLAAVLLGNQHGDCFRICRLNASALKKADSIPRSAKDRRVKTETND